MSEPEIVYSYDVREMSREALEAEVLSGREQLRKWKRRLRKLRLFWRAYFEEYGIPDPDDPTYDPENPTAWRPPELDPPSCEELLRGYHKQRRKLADLAYWINW